MVSIFMCVRHPFPSYLLHHRRRLCLPTPPPPVAPIPDASWHAFVAECLAEAPVTGECTTWASGNNNYGTMPNWDTSLVTDMSGWGTAAQGFMGKPPSTATLGGGTTSSVTNMRYMLSVASAFNQDIGGWSTEKSLTWKVC